MNDASFQKDVINEKTAHRGYLTNLPKQTFKPSQTEHLTNWKPYALSVPEDFTKSNSTKIATQLEGRGPFFSK